MPKIGDAARRKIIIVGFTINDCQFWRKGYGETEEQEIATISRSLKAIAKRIKCSCNCSFSVIRTIETRPNKKTSQLSDLRESGAIEQDADIMSLSTDQNITK